MRTLLKTLMLVGSSALLFLGGCGDAGDQETAEAKGPKKSRLIKEVKPQLGNRQKVRKPKKKLSKKERKELRRKRLQARAEAVSKALTEPPADLSPADQKTFKSLKNALDNENYTGVRDAAAAALKSPSAELRSEAVRALSWFGSKSLASLTGFLADGDEDVAQEAQNAWESALTEIEDDATKLAYIETAMSSIDNEEMLDALSQNFNQVEDESAAVESMIRVVGNGGKGAEKAKEAYEFMTGEDWTTPSAAKKWAADKRTEKALEAPDGE